MRTIPRLPRLLLDEAGYTLGADGIRAGMCDGVETKLSFNFETTDKQIRVDIALAAQSDLAKIGIEFKPIHTPAGTFFATYTDGGIMATGKFDMAGYTTGFYPDPMTGVMDSYACATVPSAANPAGVNNYLLCDPSLDELLACGECLRRSCCPQDCAGCGAEVHLRSILCGHDVRPRQRVRLRGSLRARALRLLQQHELERRSLGCQVTICNSIKTERQGIPCLPV